jgi:organic radical activating enzyme
LTITGGEPGLYPDHVRNLIETYRNVGNSIGCSINTIGYNPELNGLTRIKLSCNDYVKSDPTLFPGCTLQTVNEKPSVSFIKKFMDENAANSFKIRFLSELKKKDYDIDVWNNLQNDSEINVTMFRIGDFFVNATFGYHGKIGQLALGDMWQQKQNDYQDGYSNIIVHPDGKIGLNWS